VPVVPNPDIAKLVALLSALAVDLAFGDPPNRYHPVAGIGRLLRAGQRWLCHGSPSRLLVAGALTTIAVAGLAAVAAALVSRIAAGLGIAGILLEALALSSLLSLRDLIGAARSVARDLDRGDLAAAREAVGYHLVSRPTAALDEGQVASATIESVAENLTDSLVAPVCFFLAGGLVWAAVYRVINTADSVLGFRRGPLEYFGKSAARLDDLVNLIPARIAGLSLVAGAALAGESPRGALAALRTDRGRTQSPNSGWPMSAMAGALGVVLEKPGVHRLGAGAPPVAADIERAVRVVAAASAVSVALAVSVFAAGALVLGPAR
jgi:adenosylcobinamide-phosphate synthase